jgi:predicted peptidase
MPHSSSPAPWSVLILGLSLLNPMNSPAQTNPPPVSAHRATFEITRTVEMNYLLYLPPGYATQAGQTWPLLLFLHGAGERGTDVQRVAVHGPLKLVRQGTNFPFIIVAPLCPAGERWQNDSLLKLLDDLEGRLAVDRRRVYLTGLSMGGYGTWSLGLSHPKRFAAIVPICGGGQRIDILLGSRDEPEAFRNLPVWAFHGAKDPVVPLSESEQTVKLLQAGGNKTVKLTVYPEAQHDSWTETYNNPELYAWLLKHSR